MKIALPLFVLFIAGLITALFVMFQPEPELVAPDRPVTAVEVLHVQPETVQLHIRSQGTVLPETEIDLYAEVSGQIIEVAENFRTGASFKKGDVLLRIDAIDYEATVAGREAEVATAALNLAREEALSEQASADWKAMGEGDASPLTLRKPQLEQAKAALKSAQALLEQAKQNLAKTELSAPFDGRILSKSVDLGQYLAAAPASTVARIYASDTAEIRLPLSQREISFLNVDTESKSKVALRNTNQIEVPNWTAQLDRIEATIDTSSRLLYAVAIIEDAFSGENPIRRGQFLEATIEGKTLEAAYSLPRYALRGSNTVYVLTDENRLQTRTVEVIKSDLEQVIIGKGLQPGDRVATSPIAYFVENMPVEVIH